MRIPEETKEKLDKLAQATHRSKSFLAEEAIARYIDLEAWQVGEIEQAIQEADRGDFALDLVGPVEEVCRLNGCGALRNLEQEAAHIARDNLKPLLRWFHKQMSPPVF